MSDCCDRTKACDERCARAWESAYGLEYDKCKELEAKNAALEAENARLANLAEMGRLHTKAAEKKLAALEAALKGIKDKWCPALLNHANEGDKVVCTAGQISKACVVALSPAAILKEPSQHAPDLFVEIQKATLKVFGMNLTELRSAVAFAKSRGWAIKETGKPS